MAAIIGIIVGCATIWGLVHPNRNSDNNFQLLMAELEKIRTGNVIQPQPTATLLTVASPSAQSSSMTTASNPSDSPDTFVAMDTLSTQGIGLQMAHATYAKISPNTPNQINVVLRVTSVKSAFKIFAVNSGNLAGWSVTTASGVHCTVQPYELSGIQLFSSYDYDAHIAEMQTIAPGQTLLASIGISCERVYPADKFYLTAQLHALPSSVVAGSPQSQVVDVVNFSSNAITLQ